MSALSSHRPAPISNTSTDLSPVPMLDFSNKWTRKRKIQYSPPLIEVWRILFSGNCCVCDPPPSCLDCLCTKQSPLKGEFLIYCLCDMASENEKKTARKRPSSAGGGVVVAVVVVMAAAGFAASTQYGGTRIESLRQELTTSAAAILNRFNITIPGLTFQSHNATTPTPGDSSCTCGVKRLSGMVDDCCCEYETVDNINQQVLQPLLEELVQKPFFRYFKVRLWCDCPFWREDGMCHSRDCSVGECSEEEVPLPLKKKNGKNGKASPAPSQSAGPTPAQPGTESALAAELAAVDRSVDRSAFMEWVEEDNPWTHDNETNDEEFTYVNLVLNPERYTGYKGDSARRIWEAIYQESCFQDGPKDVCRERRVFYRLISGFHMSITVHVSTSFLHNDQSGEWGPHLDMFKWRVANFPDRLSNLYFTFLFVLRAAMKASDYLSVVSYDTGNPTEDLQTVELVRSLVANERLKAACPLPFDEAELWKGDEGPQLFSTLQKHFRNISAIMDCVGCERCRLWGKLEMLGLATALKIMFSVDGQEKNCPIALHRNEVTALINTLSRFSEALKSAAEMMALLERHDSEAPKELPKLEETTVTSQRAATQ